jgi:hypothetical protein
MSKRGSRANSFCPTHSFRFVFSPASLLLHPQIELALFPADTAAASLYQGNHGGPKAGAAWLERGITGQPGIEQMILPDAVDAKVFSGVPLPSEAALLQ